MKTVKNFNPKKPKCPECDRHLRNIIQTVHYPDYECVMNIYICVCGTAAGVVVMDNPTDEPYVIEEVTPKEDV